MTLYCGIDLHSNNHMVMAIDEEDRRLVGKRLHRLESVMSRLDPFPCDDLALGLEAAEHEGLCH